MTLSFMKEVLESRGILLTKSLGQNFLHDSNQLRRIMAAAELSPEDAVLEIGPGLGPLTENLVGQAGTVLAIEKDERLLAWLQSRFASEPRLTLVRADALDYLQAHPGDWSRWKLVSNLPFSVASTLLSELAQSPQPPERLIVTIQLEVARRLMAPPRAPNYGVLTLLIGLRYRIVGWFKIPRGCFFPEPDVDSACVVLQQRVPALLPNARLGLFARLIRCGFSQRRKMCLKVLKEEFPSEPLSRAFQALELSPHSRAESISLEQFVELTKALADGSS